MFLFIQSAEARVPELKPEWFQVDRLSGEITIKDFLRELEDCKMEFGDRWRRNLAQDESQVVDYLTYVVDTTFGQKPKVIISRGGWESRNP